MLPIGVKVNSSNLLPPFGAEEAGREDGRGFERLASSAIVERINRALRPRGHSCLGAVDGRARRYTPNTRDRAAALRGYSPAKSRASLWPSSKYPKRRPRVPNVKEKRKAGTRAGLAKAAIVAAAAKLIESVGANGFSLRKLSSVARTILPTPCKDRRIVTSRCSDFCPDASSSRLSASLSGESLKAASSCSCCSAPTGAGARPPTPPAPRSGGPSKPATPRLRRA